MAGTTIFVSRVVMCFSSIPLDVLPFPAIVIEENGVIVAINSKAAQVLGVTNSDAAGFTLGRVLKCHEAGEYVQEVTDARTNSGVDILMINCGAFEGNAGGPEFTLLKLDEGAEQKAFCSDEKIHYIVNASASVIIMCDTDGIIQFASRAAGVLLGYDEKELVGVNVEELVPHRLRNIHVKYRDAFSREMAPRAMGRKSKVSAVHKDGYEIPIEIVLTPIDELGAKIMCTIIDLTDHVAAEIEISKKAEELAQLNAELSNFANSASHDLKAPLCSIEGLLSLCVEDLDDGNLEELKVNLEEAVLISRFSARKIEKILELARAGNNKLSTETFSLEAEVSSLWRSLRSAGTGSAVLMLDLHTSDFVTTERAALNMILSNLVSNALRYKDPEKTEQIIRMSSDVEGDRLHISVKDNGRGISEKNLQRVFTYFSRFDELSREGVGLALVRKQIDRLGGAISVASVEGQGAEFSFFLPMKAEEQK